MKIFLFLSTFLIPCLMLHSQEPNPPNWSATTYIFSPGMEGAQDLVDGIYKEMGGNCNNGQFSSSRYALLFKPGVHNLNVKVGYYTSVIGLGVNPTDTDIGQVSSPEACTSSYKNGALCTFWRSAENFKIKPTSLPWTSTTGMLWAVSQASPLRRVFVDGDLYLHQYVSGDGTGYASGGFMANCNISGTVLSGSQQQWLTRNTTFSKWNNSVWNMVFVGCENAPKSNCGNKDKLGAYTTVDDSPIIAEKPYITFESEKFYLTVPPVEINKTGASTDWNAGNKIDFSQIYVAQETDEASFINSKLESGLHLVLSPGNYFLSESICITHPNTCVLGIGYPTLISQNGSECIKIDNVDGVRISGILLQAGTPDSSNATQPLLQWGNAGYAGSIDNPGFLYDCFARVGGANNSVTNPMRADILVQINSGHVVCDNLWLWRADHDVQGHVADSRNTCKTGLQINGDNVIAYGLGVEHTLQNLTEWFGENGKTYFYQSELPYDVTQDNYATPGYVAYKVGDNVINHNAWGVGVYSAFDHSVTVNSGIKFPLSEGIKFINSLSVFLSGKGGISHVIQKGDEFDGDAVDGDNQTAYTCSS